MDKDTRNQVGCEVAVEQVMGRIRGVVERLVAWVSTGGAGADLEQQVVAGSKEVGRLLMSELCPLAAPRYPAPTVACVCGGQAPYQRLRTMQTTTLLDTIQVRRAYYLCQQCHQGQAPLDEQLGFCPGGFSAGVTEVLAYLGVTQDSFEQASEVLAKLSFLQVSASSVRQVTETVGALVLAEEDAQLAQAWQAPHSVAPPSQGPQRLYISMDGTMVNVRQEGWKESKVGACFTTTARPSRQRPEQMTWHAEQISYVADLTAAESFGRLLWTEAQRRGVEQAQEVVVLGDGAEWIWRIAAEHFPQATQIVDWYHASQYVWQAAHAIHGAGEMATRWAERALDSLWQGKLLALCANLKKYAAREPVRVALSYFLNNQQRMRYDQYRQRGLQVGSGTIESACKHVVGQRLKLAGMRWNRAQARAVVKLRARLKSNRWHETVALYAPHRRRLTRRAA